MKSSSFPQWKGFEISPEGCLLEQVIDLSGEMGFAYERSCDFYKDFHSHDRLMLVFPRGSSSMEVRTKTPKKTLSVDSSSVLTIPRDLDHDDEGTSSIYDTMAFYPSEKLISIIASKLQIPLTDLSRLSKEYLKFRRSLRLNQMVQDFFFEKVVIKNDGENEDLRYLGRKILEESFRTLFSTNTNRPPQKTETAYEEVTTLALKFIESNLFEPMDLPLIAKEAGASVPTLNRKFKIGIGQTPYSYIKSRRLEEAMLLLKSGSYPVGQVALLVGYENFGAFTDAFKSKYGKPPSFFTKR